MYRFYILLVLPLLLSLPTQAGVVLDGTMGTRGTLPPINNNYDIGANLGQLRGGNLFHSFRTFNIANGEAATFNGQPGVQIQNVIARVTGRTPSSIDGTIRSTIDGANVYLFNPYGVIFGPHSSLDVRGSFYASTANTIKFADGKQFSASHPTESTLTSAAPEAFGFLEPNPAIIRCDHCRLSVPDFRTLEFVSGGIDVEGDSTHEWSASINAPKGRVALAAVSEPGDIPVDSGADPNDPNASTNFWIAGSANGAITLVNANVNTGMSDSNGGGNPPPPPRVRRASLDVSIPATAVVMVGGAVKLNGSQITDKTQDSDSRTTRILARDFSLYGGDPFSGHSSMISSSTSGRGNAGPIIMNTKNLTLNDSALISSTTSGSGNAGSITLQAQNLVLDKTSVISSSAEMPRFPGAPPSTGNAGNVRIHATNLKIWGGSKIDSTTSGSGNAGPIIMNTKNLTLNDSALISSTTSGSGNAGPITLQAQNLVLNKTSVISGGTEVSNLPGAPSSTGNGGNITINATNLEVLGGSRIDNTTRGAGRAGNLNIISRQLLVSGYDAVNPQHGSHLFSAVWDNATGSGGDVNIRTSKLTLKDGGSISTETKGQRNTHAGKINITADAISLDGRYTKNGKVSSIFANSEFKSDMGNSDSIERGDAGDITINTHTLEIRNGASIDSTTNTKGNGGTINVKVSENLVMDGVSSTISTVSSLTENAGHAGNIVVAAQNLDMLNGASIQTTAKSAGGGNVSLAVNNRVYLRDGNILTSVHSGSGNGGSITIDPRFVVLSRSQIVADADLGRGGNITIDANTILRSAGSVIRASSNLGLNGNIQLNAPNQVSNGTVATLPSDYLAIDQQLSRNCKPRERGSQLLVRPAQAVGDVVKDWVF
ncbi:exported hypothetical protein [Gammaproteobacteria bacterium]